MLLRTDCGPQYSRRCDQRSLRIDDMKGAARATEEKFMGFQENILMRTSAPEHLLISALEYPRPVPESNRGKKSALKLQG